MLFRRFQAKETKVRRVTSGLRAAVLRGELQPKQALPNTQTLADTYEVGQAIVEEALQVLRLENMIVGENASEIAEAPPHLSHFGVVFPFTPTLRRPEGTAASVLRRTAEQMPASSPYRVTIYYADDGRRESKNFQRLLNDVSEFRLAGLLFSQMPRGLYDTLPMTQTELARVAFSSEPIHVDAPLIWFNYQSFVDKALSYFAERQRQRIVVLNAVNGALAPDARRYLSSRLQAMGMVTERSWMLSSHPASMKSEDRLGEILAMPDSARPDGLLICDDSLLNSAHRTVAASGLRIPEQLDVIEAVNFPSAVPKLPGVRRLGFDIPSLFRTGLHSLIQQRGEPSATREMAAEAIAAFEDELEYAADQAVSDNGANTETTLLLE